jgi:hypothetical protein
MAKRFLLLILVASVLSLSTIGQNTRREKSDSVIPPPQVLDGKFEIKVTGIDKVQEWKMFPTSPFSPKVKAKEGEVITVVKFEVLNVKTKKIDSEESFSKFELEDEKGNKYESLADVSDSREVPFAVPQGAGLKIFRISGLAFDIDRLAKRISQKN